MILAGAASQLHSLPAVLIALALLTTPDMRSSGCADVSARYTAAVAKIVEAIRAYEKCVSAGDKRNDCAAEMQALDSAHDDFVDVVDDAKDCR